MVEIEGVRVYEDHVESDCPCGVTHRLAEKDGKPIRELIYKKPDGAGQPEKELGGKVEALPAQKLEPVTADVGTSKVIVPSSGTGEGAVKREAQRVERAPGFRLFGLRFRKEAGT